MSDCFGQRFRDLPVLVTGHTGFKGSWLSAWLAELGARVVGFSLPEPPTEPSHFEVSGIAGRITDLRGNVCDLATLRDVIETHRPAVVFHLAGQAIVLRAYEQPKTTFDTNAAGTVNVLEAIRTSDSVRALVSITTDKVYRNQGWEWGYRENDPIGDTDPYGASKAMAELAIAAYRQSFFPRQAHCEHAVAIASTRAGNVIGGGDFAEYRLVPDCMRALAAGEAIQVRNPASVRPWQHVLEPLSGYLALALRLLSDGPDCAEAWNFGPGETRGITAQAVAEKLIALWGSGSWKPTRRGPGNPETGYLRLNWDKAARRLDWRPVYTLDDALHEVVDWHKSLQAGADMGRVCREHIDTYVDHARRLGLSWAQP